MPIHEELTQQVWNSEEPSIPRQNFAGQAEATERRKKSIPASAMDAPHASDAGSILFDVESILSDSDDDDFGDFETAKTSQDDDSWVHVSPDIPELTEDSAVDATSPPPSPLSRGYLRSTQHLEAYMHPMDFADEASTLGDLLAFEASDYNSYTPLVKTDIEATSATQARHGTPTKRMWSLGKAALAKLASARQGAGKQAQQVVASWKAGFVDGEHEELRRVVEAAGKVPMAVKSDKARPDVSRSVVGDEKGLPALPTES